MNPDQLRRFINACRDGSPEVTLERGVAELAKESLHINGGIMEIKMIIAGMTEGDFTAAHWADQRFQRKPHLSPLQNYTFYYRDDKAFLSFYCLRIREVSGKIKMLEGFGIKSFHVDNFGYG